MEESRCIESKGFDSIMVATAQLTPYICIIYHGVSPISHNPSSPLFRVPSNCSQSRAANRKSKREFQRRRKTPWLLFVISSTYLAQIGIRQYRCNGLDPVRCTTPWRFYLFSPIYLYGYSIYNYWTTWSELFGYYATTRLIIFLKASRTRSTFPNIWSIDFPRDLWRIWDFCSGFHRKQEKHHQH